MAAVRKKRVGMSHKVKCCYLTSSGIVRYTGIRIWNFPNDLFVVVKSEYIRLVEHSIGALFDIDTILCTNCFCSFLCQFVHVEPNVPFGKLFLFINDKASSGKLEKLIM